MKGNSVYKVKTNLFGLPPQPGFPPPDKTVPVPNPTVLINDEFFYPWLAQELPGHLLSSWAPPSKLDYRTYDFPGNDVFLKCDGRALRGMPVASACVKGGRSGYSVKLISCDTVQSFPTGETKKPDPMDGYCL